MLYVWKMWNAKVLPCVDAPVTGHRLLQVCQCDSENDLGGLCVRPVERGSYCSILVIPLRPFSALFISFPFINLLEALLFIGWQCLKNRIW